ncbi:unnamed protein product, partial [Brassica rapa]
GVRLTRPLDPGPKTDQVRKSVGPLSRTSSRPIAPRFYPDGRIGSVSERLCNVSLDYCL